MKLARLIQIHAMEAALLSAASSSEALPLPSRAPLSLIALDTSQHWLALISIQPGYSRANANQSDRVKSRCGAAHTARTPQPTAWSS